MPKNSPEPGGRKDDAGKPPMSLVSRRAMEEEAKVLDFGKRKYDAWNWSEGIAWSRCLDAVLRHVYAYCDGESLDPESGLSHLAHARCGLGFLLDFEQSHPELDDRRKRAVFGRVIPVSSEDMRKLRNGASLESLQIDVS